MKMFLEEITISVGELSKADGPPQCGWPSSSLLRARLEQKDEGKANLLSLLELRHPSSLALLLLGFWTQPGT